MKSINQTARFAPSPFVEAHRSRLRELVKDASNELDAAFSQRFAELDSPASRARVAAAKTAFIEACARVAEQLPAECEFQYDNRWEGDKGFVALPRDFQFENWATADLT